MSAPTLSSMPRRLGARGALLLASLWSATVFAQTDEERAGARAAATEGLEAFQAGKWAEASELFTRAEALVHAPTHLLFLARALEKQSKLVKARETYQKLVRETLPAGAPAAFHKAQASAAEELAALEPRIPGLRIKITGADKPAGLKVVLDGKAINPNLVGVSLPVDPGEHEVAATANGYASKVIKVSVKESQKETVEVALEAGAPPPAITGPAEPPGEEPATKPDGEPASGGGEPATKDSGAGGAASGGIPVTAYVAFGVGALGLAAGTIFGLSSSGSRSDADAKLAECGDPCLKTDPAARESQKLYDDAGSAQTLSLVGFGVGAVGIGAGVVLMLLGDGGETPAAQQSFVRPYAGPGSLGVYGAF
ncbi:MAG: hypothetical protein IT376_17205 [Polyangiaceae bacterium]|nr:hypothetical protein [Polyangiaceae bacterium]